MKGMKIVLKFLLTVISIIVFLFVIYIGYLFISSSFDLDAVEDRLESTLDGFETWEDEFEKFVYSIESSLERLGD